MSRIELEVLGRYLAGTASAEECRLVEAWLAEDPQHWERLTAAREALEKRDLSDAAVETALTEVWGRLAPEVGLPESMPARPQGRSRRAVPDFTVVPRRRRLVMALAAAVVVLTIGGGLAATLLLRRVPAPAAAWRMAKTAPGERATLRLPDGTQVMLSVASAMRYPAGFAAEAREVELEGEAYFEVAHEVRRPFLVRAGELVAQDLGTQFTVRAYPEEPGASVVVREGAVAIRSATNGVRGVVTPGHLGRLTVGGVPVIELVDTAVWFAWTEGRLVFEGTPLREAMPELGRWFDLEFRLADSALGDVPLTATLKHQPTPDVLKSLAASLGLRHQRVGRTVTFSEIKRSP